MLRATLKLEKPSYLYREPHFPYLKKKSRYKFKLPIRKLDVLSNKTNPDEWTSIIDSRMGVDWYHKARRRHHYVGWPYISWRHDPIRHHKTNSTARTLSAKMASAGNAGYPLWDHYEESGLDYELPSSAPLTAAQPFILIHTGSTWSFTDVTSFCKSITQQFPTVETISKKPDALREWRDTTPEGNKVPHGFIEHVVLLCRDILRNNAKKDYRRLLHANGVLRTNEMQRYYALPLVRDGPAMPEKLEQASGQEFQGEYVWLTKNAMDSIHPLYQKTYRPDSRHSFYDA